MQHQVETSSQQGRSTQELNERNESQQPGGFLGLLAQCLPCSCGPSSGEANSEELSGWALFDALAVERDAAANAQSTAAERELADAKRRAESWERQKQKWITEFKADPDAHTARASRSRLQTEKAAKAEQERAAAQNRGPVTAEAALVAFLRNKGAAQQDAIARLFATMLTEEGLGGDTTADEADTEPSRSRAATEQVEQSAVDLITSARARADAYLAGLRLQSSRTGGVSDDEKNLSYEQAMEARFREMLARLDTDAALLPGSDGADGRGGDHEEDSTSMANGSQRRSGMQASVKSASEPVRPIASVRTEKVLEDVWAKHREALRGWNQWILGLSGSEHQNSQKDRDGSENPFISSCVLVVLELAKLHLLRDLALSGLFDGEQQQGRAIGGDPQESAGNGTTAFRLSDLALAELCSTMEHGEGVQGGLSAKLLEEVDSLDKLVGYRVLEWPALSTPNGDPAFPLVTVARQAQRRCLRECRKLTAANSVLVDNAIAGGGAAPQPVAVQYGHSSSFDLEEHRLSERLAETFGVAISVSSPTAITPSGLFGGTGGGSSSTCSDEATIALLDEALVWMVLSASISSRVDGGVPGPGTSALAQNENGVRNALRPVLALTASNLFQRTTGSSVHQLFSLVERVLLDQDPLGSVQFEKNIFHLLSSGRVELAFAALLLCVRLTHPMDGMHAAFCRDVDDVVRRRLENNSSKRSLGAPAGIWTSLLQKLKFLTSSQSEPGGRNNQ